jgi:pyruvate kinase
LIPNGKGIQIISKIDTLDGVKKLTEILQETDGIIFVRNEL